MPSRFYIAPTSDQPAPAPDLTLSLNPDQSHYLHRVLRHRAGDSIHCFDGEGTTFAAKITQAHSKHSQLVVQSVAAVTRDPHAPQVALALLKGAAMDRAIQQSVEAGAAAITLFRGARSNVQLDERRAQNKLAHWQKIIVSACEQSGQAYLPTLVMTDSVVTAEQALATPANELLLLDLNAPRLTLHADLRPIALIGAEGGWGPEELDYLQRAGARRVSIGASTLRAETTPAAVLTLINYLREQNGRD